LSFIYNEKGSSEGGQRILIGGVNWGFCWGSIDIFVMFRSGDNIRIYFIIWNVFFSLFKDFVGIINLSVWISICVLYTSLRIRVFFLLNK
jgi:hypothetical protein